MYTIEDKKKPYEAPQLTVASFKVEQGFIGSAQNFSIGMFPLVGIGVDGMQDYNVQNIETW